MDTATTDFASSPLITPERLAAEPQAALAVRPAWVRRVFFVAPGPHPEPNPAVQPPVIIWAGKTRTLYEAHTTLAAAIMWEITRLPGLSIAVNSNGGAGNYLRFTIGDEGEDLTTVSRFLSNAGPHEQVNKTKGRKWDMRTETLRVSRAGKPSKESRSVVMGHVERIAREVEERGAFPPHITAETYLANLYRLIAMADLEATGRELHDILPLVPERR